jgi:hypothetical protein
VNIIKPESITASKLISSNILEDEYPLYNPVVHYHTGDRVIYEHKIYESLVNNHSGHFPDVSPSYWVLVSATNRFKMFDSIVSNPSTHVGTIEFTVRLGAIVGGMALFNVSAATVRVVMTAPGFGTVYDRTVDLSDYSDITSWYAYYFGAVGERSRDVILTDLPSYAAADITVTIDNGLTAIAECGEAVFGVVRNIGTTSYGTSHGIRDYTRKEADAFGNFVVVPRRFAKIADYDIQILSNNTGSVQKFLASIRATPCVFIGDQRSEGTIVYGFYKDFRIVLNNFTFSGCNLQVEGLT